MACCLSDAKPLCELITIYHQLCSEQHISMKFMVQRNLIHEIADENPILRNVPHFRSGHNVWIF